MELKAYLSYRRLHQSELTFWQEKNGKEVDFVIGDELAVEVKTCDKISEKHLKGLRYFMEEKCCQRYLVVSHDKLEMHLDGIESMHWETFLRKLWNDELLSL